MQNPEEQTGHRPAAGFALPSILVVVGALLILAVGILLVMGIERDTARSFVDRERAELSARAGLEEVRGLFIQEAANDDFMVIQSSLAAPIVAGTQVAPNLFLARGETKSSGLTYRYIPMFSCNGRPADNDEFAVPELQPLFPTGANQSIEFTALPYLDKVRVAWKPVENNKGQMVGRYAYWVEDLQSRVDAGTAGNELDSGSHLRYGWKAGDTSKFARFPAPGLNPEESKISVDGTDSEPPLNPVALYLLDPESAAKDKSKVDNKIIDGHAMLISPDSTLAAAGVEPPLVRGADRHLTDSLARSIEENLTAEVKPYDELAVVPFAHGIDPSVVGKQKLNLNALLAKPADTAVDEMADWIKKALPTFDNRKGGFPDDYLRTLAANAIDYADADSDGTVKVGSYRGLDAYPLMSEVILHIKYLGSANLKGRKTLLWQFLLYTELWNHTSQPVHGSFRASYENGMILPGIGSGVSSLRFDDPEFLDDTAQSQHDMTKIGDRYWSAPRAIDLQPNQYQFYKAATVNYTMDIGPATATYQDTFIVDELLGSSGISLMWNDREVDRSDRLIRGNSDGNADGSKYTMNLRKQSGKANIPGHSYGIYNTVNNYKNNMGDSRQALYLRTRDYPLSDNSYPGNVSPNRRNIRNATIYKNASDSQSVYGRVLPSEWPDGGHDTEVTGLPSSPTLDNYDPTIYPAVTNAREGDAPTMISNRGRFYSVTELGRIYDPIMFKPKYDNAGDTTSLLSGKMPASRVSWPSVEIADETSVYYGGGNTLRVGRPEHPNFDRPMRHAPSLMSGEHAARLLDLFHAGKSRSETSADREGPLVRIDGHININTASKASLRAMAGGILVADPKLSKRTSSNHSTSTFAPPVSSLEVSTPSQSLEADTLADAIIRGRPYTSPSEIATALTADGFPAFGNRDLLPDGNKVQWTDAAAEEAFARVYQSSTVRSRNFRIWVVGQTVAPTATTTTAPKVLAEVRKAYTVFVDPGVRKADGSIDSTKFRVRILHENDF